MLRSINISPIQKSYLFLSVIIFCSAIAIALLYTADSDYSKILSITILSTGIVVLMAWLWRDKDPLLIIVLCYYYSSYGPVINYLLGNDIYVGIIQSRILEASFVFALSLISMFVSGLIFKVKVDFRKVKHNLSNIFNETNCSALSFPMVVLIAFTCYLLYTYSHHDHEVLKNQKISAVGAIIHYNYLLIQSYVLAFYFFIRKHRNLKRLYIVNFVIYIAYCFYFSERDFVFIVVTLVWYSYLFNSAKGRFSKQLLLVVLVTALVYLSTYIFKFRAFDHSIVSVADVLNQGSLLFINTRIIEFVDSNNILMYGKTYLNSIMNLLPSWIYHTDFNLPNWFKLQYAPTGISGYGFALDAEAYLNFKHIGIPPFFMLIVLFYRFTLNRIGRGGFYLYLNIFYTIALVYCIRNDSLSLFKATFYAAIFYWIVYFVGRGIKLVRE